MNTRISRFCQKIWRAIQDWCASWVQPLFSLVALLSGTFVTANFDTWKTQNPAWAGPIEWVGFLLPIIFIASAVTAFVASVVIVIRGKNLQKMQNELSVQKGQIAEIGNVIIILCDGLLLNLANKLKLEQKSQARLSLYVHNAESKSFIPCGRYSRNPNFGKPGRTSYPDNQGCIARGWNDEWYFDNNVPPASQAEARRNYNLKNYNVPKDVTDLIGMKSTLYAVRRLDNLEGKAIAVIVVEAVDANDFVEAELRAMIDGSANDYARVIHELRSYVPSPANAEESGL